MLKCGTAGPRQKRSFIPTVYFYVDGLTIHFSWDLISCAGCYVNNCTSFTVTSDHWKSCSLQSSSWGTWFSDVLAYNLFRRYNMFKGEGELYLSLNIQLCCLIIEYKFVHIQHRWYRWCLKLASWLTLFCISGSPITKLSQVSAFRCCVWEAFITPW